jgi:hypothetical protein
MPYPIARLPVELANYALANIECGIAIGELLFDGFPECRHSRIVNADAFQSLVRLLDIIEIRAPDSCSFSNHPRFINKRYGIIDQIPPLVNEDLGGDCPAVLKLNGKCARLAGFSFLKITNQSLI